MRTARDRIATVSEYSKRDIHETLKVDLSLIDVVFNGVSSAFKAAKSEEFQAIKAKYSQGKDYFVFLGTIHPRKNLKHLLLAFDHFKMSNKGDEKLLIVGNRKWWPKEIDDAFRSLVHQKDVIFTARLEDEEVSKVLSASIALTYLPFFEGFGIPILEAFKCKNCGNNSPQHFTSRGGWPMPHYMLRQRM